MEEEEEEEKKGEDLIQFVVKKQVEIMHECMD